MILQFPREVLRAVSKIVDWKQWVEQVVKFVQMDQEFLVRYFVFFKVFAEAELKKMFLIIGWWSRVQAWRGVGGEKRAAYQLVHNGRIWGDIAVAIIL